MSELQQYETNEVAQNSPWPSEIQMPSGVVDLHEWALELQAADTLARTLCKTDFVPKEFRGKPEAATAAILAGKALGLDPMNSLSNIFVVHGKPALYARTMAGMVMQHGHELIRAEATPQAVTYMARRKGQAEWQEFTWTIERAKTAGYTSNTKYKTDPIAMLTAKAQAEACRTIAPDVLTGVAAYSVEEHQLENIGEAPSRPSRVAKPVEAPTIESAPAFESVSREQWDELVAAGHQHGLEPAQVGALAADTIGYDLTGWKDVPADQYDNIMAAIHQGPADGQTEYEANTAAGDAEQAQEALENFVNG